MPLEQYLVDNHAGWRLAMSRRRPAGDAPPAARPVLIVPGYGMNSYIFGFHPRGPSMIDCLSARGLEVWTVDLRGQGRSIRARGNNRYGLADLAIEDLGAAIAHVLANTTTGATHARHHRLQPRHGARVRARGIGPDRARARARLDGRPRHLEGRASAGALRLRLPSPRRPHAHPQHAPARAGRAAAVSRRSPRPSSPST